MTSRFSTQKHTSIDGLVTQQEIERMAATKQKYETVLFTTDHHYPYMDKEMRKVELQILSERKPKYHVLGGDWIDASGMSTFLPKAGYIDETQNEIDGFVLYLSEMYKASPKTKRVMIYGNHDQARLDRAKAETPFGLAGLRVLSYEKLFKEAAQYHGVEIGDITFTKEWFLGPGMKFIHGDGRMDKRLKGGVTGVRRTVSEYPGDYHIIMGHGHRMQVGRHPWMDRQVHMVGAMMDVNQVGYEPHSQYENGMALIQYSPNSRPNPVYHIQNSVKAPNGDVVFGDAVYNGRR